MLRAITCLLIAAAPIFCRQTAPCRRLRATFASYSHDVLLMLIFTLLAAYYTYAARCCLPRQR